MFPDRSGSIKGLTSLLQDLGWQFSAAGREEIVLFCVILCCLCLSDHKATWSKLSLLVESETESQMGCLWSGRLLSWPQEVQKNMSRIEGVCVRAVLAEAFS